MDKFVLAVGAYMLLDAVLWAAKKPGMVHRDVGTITCNVLVFAVCGLLLIVSVLVD